MEYLIKGTVPIMILVYVSSNPKGSRTHKIEKYLISKGAAISLQTLNNKLKLLIANGYLEVEKKENKRSLGYPSVNVYHFIEDSINLEELKNQIFGY